MGFSKATTRLAGVSPIERIGLTLKGRRVTIVTVQDQRTACARAVPWADIFVNPLPTDGMTSSLLIAHRGIDAACTLGVMLADKPFVSTETLERCERALTSKPSCDVLYTQMGGECGHPVYFAPNARARLNSLAMGDTLHNLRDDSRLAKRVLECDDAGILIDLDTPDAWRAAEERLHA